MRGLLLFFLPILVVFILTRESTGGSSTGNDQGTSAGDSRHQFHPYVPPANKYYSPAANYTPVVSGEMIDTPVAQARPENDPIQSTLSIPSNRTVQPDLSSQPDPRVVSPSYSITSAASAPPNRSATEILNSFEESIENMRRSREAAQDEMQREAQREKAFYENYNRQRQKEDLETAIRDDQMRKSLDSFETVRQMSSSGYGTSNSPGYNSYNPGTGANPNDVQVNGYLRSNGTYVAPYHRTAPNSTRADNYSTYPNTNPYTGRTGTRHY